eukprot:scaffold4451_cov92-Amphora_coffeaeformis.AAC.1
MENGDGNSYMSTALTGDAGIVFRPDSLPSIVTIRSAGKRHEEQEQLLQLRVFVGKQCSFYRIASQDVLAVHSVLSYRDRTISNRTRVYQDALNAFLANSLTEHGDANSHTSTVLTKNDGQVTNHGYHSIG